MTTTQPGSHPDDFVTRTAQPAAGDGYNGWKTYIDATARQAGKRAEKSAVETMCAALGEVLGKERKARATLEADVAALRVRLEQLERGEKRLKVV